MPTVLNYPGEPSVLVSDAGDVWKLQARLCRRLKARKTKSGTLVVSMPGRSSRPVHRLVLETFIGPCPDGQEARHLDGDATNNRLENLAWTPQSNPNPPGKPSKPYDTFPLFAHDNGRWAKKIGGKLRYFGPWDQWREALTAYEQFQASRIGVGLEPHQTSKLTVGDLTARFLADRREAVKSGELTQRSLADYERVCDRIVEQFGKNAQLTRLKPEEFRLFRAAMAEKWNLTTLSNEIGRIRVVFNYAGPKHLGWLQNPASLYGNAMSKPSRKSMRIKRGREQPRDLSAEEIHAVLGHCKGMLPAMVMLGINCGLGNTDCAMVTKDRLDLKAGWLSYPRPKTGVARRAKLWPETVQALRAAWDARPEDNERIQLPKELHDRWFVTKYRTAWVHDGSSCPISQAFRKALIAAGVYRKGLGFYSLRHTFQTVAEESGDLAAVSLVMGHVDHSMAAVYRERISDGRLELVAETVKKWWTSALPS